MSSEIDRHQMMLTSVVSTSPSVAASACSTGLVTKRSLLARRMTSVNRMSIPEYAPATLTFHNINYIVGSTPKLSKKCLKHSKLPLCKTREPKQVLFNVSGKFKNGMNAIMGKNFTHTSFKHYLSI